MFVPVDIFLAKPLLNLFVCPLVRNDTCGNSSPSIDFILNFDIIPVYVVATDFSFLIMYLSAYISLLDNSSLIYNTVHHYCYSSLRNFKIVSLFFPTFLTET